MALIENERQEKVKNFVSNLNQLWPFFLDGEQQIPDPLLLELLKDVANVKVASKKSDAGSLVLVKFLLTEFLTKQEFEAEELLKTVKEILRFPVSLEFSQGFVVLQFALLDLGIELDTSRKTKSNHEVINPIKIYPN